MQGYKWIDDEGHIDPDGLDQSPAAGGGALVPCPMHEADYVKVQDVKEAIFFHQGPDNE